MNDAVRFLMRSMMRAHARLSGRAELFGALSSNVAGFDLTGQPASDWIRDRIEGGEPLMVARFGAVELNALLAGHAIRRRATFLGKAVPYVRGETSPFWWDRQVARSMSNNAGFFPATDAMLSRFCDLVLEDCRSLDALGSWLRGEEVFRDRFPRAIRIRQGDILPFTHERPWSEALRGRTVLVIHPFEASIRAQYRKRELLHGDRRLLPEFELLTLKAVQSIAGNGTGYDSWFDALESMAEKVGRMRFDVALVGCGAYGFSLAAFVKRMGRQGIHMGGALQLLFGIKGKRWDDAGIYNEHWIRPLPEEVPPRHVDVEGGCYW